MKVRLYQDRDRIISTQDDAVLQGVSRLYPSIIKSGKSGSSLSFVGIAIFEDTFLVSFPKGQNVSALRNDEDLFHDATILLLRSLAKYITNNPLEASEDYSLGGNALSQNLYYAFQILDDYFKNGLVNRFKTITTPLGNGATAWPKTMKYGPVLISDSGVLYPRPYMRARITDAKDPLRLIHAHIAKECFELFGWLFSAKTPVELMDAPLNMCPKEMLAILVREKIATFSQRDLALIDLLSAFLQSSSILKDPDSCAAFGTTNFDNVWEDACQVAFLDDPALQSRLVLKPIWNRGPQLKGLSFNRNIGQIPDILSIDGDTLLVLDAKYYNTEATLPGWHDIVKQIYYQDTIERHLLSNNHLRDSLGIRYTTNAFLFPGENNDDVSFAGYVSIPEIAGSHRWGQIDAIIVDLNSCLASYIANKPRCDWIAAVGANKRDFIKEREQLSDQFDSQSLL